MPRTARIVVPDVPHHVIQRGNRNQDVFFEAADFQRYIELLHEQCSAAGTEILAYCLMSNHVHLIATPKTTEGLRPIGEAHRRYTRYLNAKNDWRGYLWQGRFASYPMDERYFYEALRYVELNPVRAGICTSPEQYRWSSAATRLGKRDTPLLRAGSLNRITDDWRSYWEEGLRKDEIMRQIEQNEISQTPQGLFNTGTK